MKQRIKPSLSWVIAVCIAKKEGILQSAVLSKGQHDPWYVSQTTEPRQLVRLLTGLQRFLCIVFPLHLILCGFSHNDQKIEERTLAGFSFETSSFPSPFCD